jgi:hypothetical protein
MILEIIRMVTDALNDNTIGVNAHLLNIPVDGSDSVPEQIVTIVDETRNNQVAIGRYPTEFPALVVTLDGTQPIEGDVLSDLRNAEVTVLIRYLCKNTDTLKGNCDTYYTMRAVQRCIQDFTGSLNMVYRVRNNIQIVDCISMEHLQLFENIEDANITGGIRATFKVRDAQP